MRPAHIVSLIHKDASGFIVWLRGSEALKNNVPWQKTPGLRTLGFTLIELIVAVSIIAIMTGGGLAIFTGFRSTRIALGDAQIVVDALNEAKRLAVAAEKPVACNPVTLTGYTVSFDVDQVDLVASCPGVSPPAKTRSLPTGNIVGSPGPVTFRVLIGSAADATVDVCSEGHLFRITVSDAGSVSEPLEIAGGC